VVVDLCRRELFLRIHHQLKAVDDFIPAEDKRAPPRPSSRHQYQRPRPYQPPPPTNRIITMMMRSVEASIMPLAMIVTRRARPGGRLAYDERAIAGVIDPRPGRYTNVRQPDRFRRK
jgi:hypothetical protein